MNLKMKIMETVMIKKLKKKFRGYNKPHQCHQNAYNYCCDYDGCKFVVGYIMSCSIPHCIVQLPNGDYIDPTLNDEQPFYIEEVYTIDEIMKIFSKEQMFFIPTQWAMNQYGEIFKYNKMERITVESKQNNMNPKLIELENAYILKNILPKAFSKRQIKFAVNSAKLYKWVENRFVYDKAIISSDRFDNGETEFQVYLPTENLDVWEYSKYIDKKGDIRRGDIFISPALYFYVVCGDKLYAYNISKLNKRNYGRGFKLSIDDAYRVFNIKNIKKEFNEKYNYINDIPIHLRDSKICELIKHFNSWGR